MATPSPAVPQTAVEKPCDLVTKAEAEAILGAPVKEPVDRSGGCMYFLVTPRPNTLADIPWMSVTRSHGTRANFDAAIKPYERGTPATAVSGLGDYAVTASSFLFVYKGDNILSIQPGNTEIPNDQVTAFATRALGRL